jgi:hypothetical protein
MRRCVGISDEVNGVSRGPTTSVSIALSPCFVILCRAESNHRNVFFRFGIESWLLARPWDSHRGSLEWTLIRVLLGVRKSQLRASTRQPTQSQLKATAKTLLGTLPTKRRPSLAIAHLSVRSWFRERRFLVRSGLTLSTAAAVRETSKLTLNRYHSKYLNNVQPRPNCESSSSMYCCRTYVTD